LYILSHLLSITEPIAYPSRLNVGSIAPKSADLALLLGGFGYNRQILIIDNSYKTLAYIGKKEVNLHFLVEKLAGIGKN